MKKNYFFYDFIFFQQIFRLLSPAPLFLRAGTQAAFLGCSVPEQKLNWVLSEVKMTIDLWSWRRLSLFQVLLPHTVQLRHLGWRHHHWHNHDNHHIFLNHKITHFWSKVFERKVTLCLTQLRSSQLFLCWDYQWLSSSSSSQSSLNLSSFTPSLSWENLDSDQPEARRRHGTEHLPELPFVPTVNDKV